MMCTALYSKTTSFLIFPFRSYPCALPTLSSPEKATCGRPRRSLQYRDMKLLDKVFGFISTCWTSAELVYLAWRLFNVPTDLMAIERESL
jgi:hypothetical protein